MAKLAADHEYTDAELLALYREAFARLSVGGQSYKIGTREYVAADLPHIRETITWLESRVESSSSGIAFNSINRKRAT